MNWFQKLLPPKHKGRSETLSRALEKAKRGGGAAYEISPFAQAVLRNERVLRALTNDREILTIVVRPPLTVEDGRDGSRSMFVYRIAELSARSLRDGEHTTLYVYGRASQFSLQMWDILACSKPMCPGAMPTPEDMQWF